jgi:hypothetical protein
MIVLFRLSDIKLGQTPLNVIFFQSALTFAVFTKLNSAQLVLRIDVKNTNELNIWVARFSKRLLPIFPLYTLSKHIFKKCCFSLCFVPRFGNRHPIHKSFWFSSPTYFYSSLPREIPNFPKNSDRKQIQKPRDLQTTTNPISDLCLLPNWNFSLSFVSIFAHLRSSQD